jgi:hypothetical protein
MAYYFFLGACPLPIPPAALSIKTPTLNKTINLINEGEVNILKGDGLKEISFEFLLPAVPNYPFADYTLFGYFKTGRFTTNEYIPVLRDLKSKNKPFPFIVVRTSPKSRRLEYEYVLCTMEDIEFKEDAEEYGFDRMCSVVLKKYVPYATKRIKVEESSDGKPGSKTAKVTNVRDSSGKDQSSIQTNSGTSGVTATDSSVSFVKEILGML